MIGDSRKLGGAAAPEVSHARARGAVGPVDLDDRVRAALSATWRRPTSLAPAAAAGSSYGARPGRQRPSAQAGSVSSPARTWA